MTCSPNQETFIYNIISYAYTVVHLDKDLHAKKLTLCKLQMTCQMSCAHDWICCFCRLAVVINNETFENEKLWRSMQHLKTTMSWDNSRRQSHLPKPSYFEYVSAALVIPKSCISGLAFKNGCPLMFLNYVVYCCFQTILYEDIELSPPTPSEQNSPERPQPATLTTSSTHVLPKPTLSQPQSHYVLIEDQILLIIGMVAIWLGLAGRISLLETDGRSHCYTYDIFVTCMYQISFTYVQVFGPLRWKQVKLLLRCHGR